MGCAGPARAHACAACVRSVRASARIYTRASCEASVVTNLLRDRFDRDDRFGGFDRFARLRSVLSVCPAWTVCPGLLVPRACACAAGDHRRPSLYIGRLLQPTAFSVLQKNYLQPETLMQTRLHTGHKKTPCQGFPWQGAVCRGYGSINRDLTSTVASGFAPSRTCTAVAPAGFSRLVTRGMRSLRPATTGVFSGST